MIYIFKCPTDTLTIDTSASQTDQEIIKKALVVFYVFQTSRMAGMRVIVVLITNGADDACICFTGGRVFFTTQTFPS